MKRVLATATMILVCGLGSASAQTPAPATTTESAERAYVLVGGGGAFGNKSSSALSGEIGVRVTPMIDVFVEGSYLKDTIPAETVTLAAPIVTYLGRFGTASFTADQPTTVVNVGAKINFDITDKMRAYVAAGGGMGKVQYRTAFVLGGTDVTGSLLGTYGVQVGGDLASVTDTAAAFMFGGGVHMLVAGPVVADASYRFNRINVPGAPLNASRVQVTVGVKF